MSDKSPTADRRRPATKRTKVRHDRVGDAAKDVAAETPHASRAGNAAALAVGSLFRSAREAQGLSQDQVAALTDEPRLPRTTISAIERGRSLPNVAALVSLSQVLHVEPGEVLEQVGLAQAIPVDFTGVGLGDLRRRAREQFWAGEYRGALAAYNAMLELLFLSPPESVAKRLRLHARIEIDRAVTLRRCGALKAARGAAERAIELSRGEVALQAEGYIGLAGILAQAGVLALATDAAERAVALADGGSLRLQAFAWGEKGSVLHRVGEYKDGRQALLRARELFEQAGERQQLSHIEGNIAECLVGMGHAKAARVQFKRAIDVARSLQLPALEASWLVALGRLDLDGGRLGEADRHAQAALTLAKPLDHQLTVFRAEWLRHRIARRRDPNAEDRHRIAFLKKLYVRLKSHAGATDVREFKEAVLASPATERGGHHD